MLGFIRVVWGERIDWDCFGLVQVSVALMSGEGLYSQWNKQTNKYKMFLLSKRNVYTQTSFPVFLIQSVNQLYIWSTFIELKNK